MDRTPEHAPLIEDAIAAILFSLDWERDGVRYRDCRFAEAVNLSRDLLPAELERDLDRRTSGETVGRRYAAGVMTPGFDPAKVRRIGLDSLDETLAAGTRIAPDFGRFYPQGVLHRLPGNFKASRVPFRVLEADETGLVVDLNHPLADVPLTLSAEIRSVGACPHGQGPGGHRADWAATLTDGPGLQARAGTRPTEFFYEGALTRLDEADDARFYAVPRIIAHLDARAQDVVRELHARHLKRGMTVLDLMSSVHSHLPNRTVFAGVTGLGLNIQEMEANHRLSERVVHDLNRDAALPFAPARFDAAVCVVSIEYLVDPVGVFEDVARVLKPGGLFIVTVSQRWFPPKVTRVWQELHPFERLGYVLECFHRSGRFRALEALSVQGYPRPSDDPNRGQEDRSDPIFAAWGRAR